jgi:secreted trypsin-like serine protease
MDGKILLLLFVAQVYSVPVKDGAINWDHIEPKYPTFTPATGPLDPEVLRAIINMGPPMSERYPGYKKGTEDFSQECGVADTRIVGGEEATPHSYPWMAALFVDDTWFCGGTLISDEWVLTAAHCAKDATEMIVMLGAHNVREASEEGRLELTTRDFFTHPSYSTLTLHNDLALVHLPNKVNFTSTIRPICLPAHSEAGTAWAHEAAVASGWGKPSDSANSISPELRRVDVETITNLMCALEFPTVVNKNIVCISGAGGKSTCNGDSGGPLYLVDSAMKHKQIGITSFGSGLGCEIGWHAGFTRTASFLEWIETNTNVMIDP